MKKMFIVTLLLSTMSVDAQVVDEVVVQIGNEIILSSDIEMQYLQYVSQGYTDQQQIRCQVIEDLLYQKLLVHQAKIDSIDVSEDDVYKELQRRISSFISQLGSQSAVEKYFGKTISQIKDAFYDVIYDQMLSQRMQSQITSSVSVTPEEVKFFFESLKDKDALPLMPSRIQISQIVKIPEISFEEKSAVRKQLISFRDRVKQGEDFAVLATLYSDDIESARSGGEIGFVSRGDLFPEFESAAFALKEGEVSEVVETKLGYHIIQLIDRKGETINVRHILIKPKVSSSSLLGARDELKRIEGLLSDGTLSFDDAARNHSDHVSKNNGGLLINPETRSSMFTLDALPSDIKYIVERMKEGDVSSISQFVMEDGRKAYRIIKINQKLNEHSANLDDDYETIFEALIDVEKQVEIGKWIDKKMRVTYTRFSDDFESCNLKKWRE